MIFPIFWLVYHFGSQLGHISWWYGSRHKRLSHSGLSSPSFHMSSESVINNDALGALRDVKVLEAIRNAHLIGEITPTFVQNSASKWGSRRTTTRKKRRMCRGWWYFLARWVCKLLTLKQATNQVACRRPLLIAGASCFLWRDPTKQHRSRSEQEGTLGQRKTQEDPKVPLTQVGYDVLGESALAERYGNEAGDARENQRKKKTT